MDWLEAHSLMQVDWRNKWHAVPYDGQVQVLQGLALVAPHQMLLHIEALPAQPPEDSTPTPVPAPVQQLLQEFQDLFPGTQPVFIRPYRYLPKLKDEIERQVQDMMNHGLIQHSSSAFSLQCC